MHIGIESFGAKVIMLIRLKQGRECDKLSLFDPRDPFKGEPVTNAWLSDQ